MNGNIFAKTEVGRSEHEPPSRRFLPFSRLSILDPTNSFVTSFSLCGPLSAMEAEQGKQDAMVLDDVVPPLVDDSMALDAPDLDAVGAYGPMLPPAEFKEYVLRLTDHTTPGTPPSRHEHRFHGARLVYAPLIYASHSFGCDRRV